MVFTFEGIGTHWEIDIRDSLSARQQSSIQQNILSTVTAFDNAYSRFITTSQVWRIKDTIGVHEVGEELIEMLLYYIPLYKLTGGAFTPAIGNLLEETGYDKDYSFKESPKHAVPDLLESIDLLDGKRIRIKKPVLLDVGALGKGYLIDTVARVLQNAGLKEYVVNAGGDMVFHTTSMEKPLTIGLEHPLDTTKVIGTVSIQNNAICGSAGNRRQWGTYHHILDPKTKQSPEDITAVWVVADNATIADALSTCLFFVEPEILLKQYSFEFCIVHAQKGIRVSKQFPGTLFT